MYRIISFYLKVHLNPAISDLFGFSIPEEDGSISYYKYSRLPFGASTAVFITDQLIKPIKIFAHRLGVDLSVYIDDGIIIEISKFKSLASTYFVISLILCSGWSFQFAKCILSPTKEIVYLGYILNSESMIISLPEVKIVKLEYLLDILFKAFLENQPIESRFLASFLGKLSHAYFTHGSFVKIVARMSNHALGINVGYFDWDSFLFVNNDMYEEFKLCYKYLRSFNGQSLKLEQASFDVINSDQISHLVTDIDPKDSNKPYFVFASDASDLEGYAYKAGDVHIVSNYLFTPSESQLSSGARELLAIVKSFHKFKPYFLSKPNSVIIWCTDSMCAYSFLKHGSRIPDIQRMLMDIKRFEFEFKLVLYPKWLSRTNDIIKVADFGSKLSNSSEEYGVSDFDFQSIQSHFNLFVTIDAFATASNCKVKDFYSAIPQVGAKDVDFFMTTLSCAEVYYVHCPVSLIQRTLNKILLYNDICVIMLLPVWPSHPFWKAFINLNFFQWFVKDFWIFNPFFVTNSKKCIFSGYKNFPTLALLIKTNEYNCIPLPPDLL